MVPDPILVGRRVIGDGFPTFVIAEAGSNHNRDYAKALELIDAAVEAGADAVKFQLFTAGRLYPRSAGVSAYLGSPQSIYDIIDGISMPPDWVPRLAQHCSDRGIEFLSSTFDEGSAAVVAPYVRLHKIASYELTHAPLVRTIARLGKPVVLSTGASRLEEIQSAVALIRAEGNDRIVVLQCTAKYPAPFEALGLQAIPTLRAKTGCHVGLSDHSRDPVVAPVAAVALGAHVIEKHFTLDNDLPGPDHRFAVEPDELKRLVEAVRSTEAALGDGEKIVHPEEEELRSFARRSIFTTRRITKGERLTSECVAVLRCGQLGYGLPPDQFDAIVGRVAARDLDAESLVRLADLE